MKHALLVWLLGAMQRKSGAIAVLDTHAGAGRYDLASTAAERTGEWREGIGRVMEANAPPLAPYIALVRSLGLYPGSPSLLRAMLRPQDRLACCELHPEEHAQLRLLFARDPSVAVHYRDGWEALGALLPPREAKRGLVLIDPPYEVRDELDRLVTGLRTASTRFPAGVLAAWYPIKHRAPVRALHEALRLSGVRDVVAAELLARSPDDPARLNGCGLLVVNPPFGFADAAAAILHALRLAMGFCSSTVETIAPE